MFYFFEQSFWNCNEYKFIVIFLMVLNDFLNLSIKNEKVLCLNFRVSVRFLFENIMPNFTWDEKY